MRLGHCFILLSEGIRWIENSTMNEKGHAICCSFKLHCYSSQWSPCCQSQSKGGMWRRLHSQKNCFCVSKCCAHRYHVWFISTYLQQLLHNGTPLSWKFSLHIFFFQTCPKISIKGFSYSYPLAYPLKICGCWHQVFTETNLLPSVNINNGLQESG